MKDLQKHIAATYTTLRLGIAVLAIALPFVLWIGGYFRAGESLAQSMSAYYYVGKGVMRDEFVGVLFAVGAFLYLYKGYTKLENYALNLAGIFLVGVAVFPMEWACGDACGKYSPHGTFAVLFFVCIAYVCIFRASDTLSLIADPLKVARYKRMYRVIGAGMIAAPAAAVVLTTVLDQRPANSTVFFVEAAGVLVFASYWILKSREIALSNSERAALEGKLAAPEPGVAGAFKQAPVQPKAPPPNPPPAAAAAA